MKKRILDLLVALAIALSLVAAGCGAVLEPTEAPEPMPTTPPGEPTEPPAPEADTPPPPAGNVLTFGLWGTMPDSRFCTLAPTTGTEEFWLRDLTTATLMTLDGNLESPHLAQGYTVSSDGSFVTFNLRDDVTWHDGQPFTANDIVFTFGLILDPAIGDYYRIFSDVISSVEAVDDATVGFSLIHPINTDDLSAASAWRSLLTGWTPVPEHILGGTPAAEICDSQWAQAIYLGLGPYKVVDFIPGVYVAYEPYAGYYGYQVGSSSSPFDQIVVYFRDNPADLLLALQAGDMDMVQTSPQFVPQIVQYPDLDIPADTALLAVRQTVWPPTDPYIYRALLEPQGETFIPYRESLSELGNLIGEASLLPQHAETEAAIQELGNVMYGVRINTARTVTLAGNPSGVHLAPFGPMSAPASANELWDAVQDNGEYVIGTFVVVEQNPYSVQAYAVRVVGSVDAPEVHFVPADGSPPIVVSGDDIDVIESGEPAESVEIPIAGMRSGSRTCWVRWDWIEFSYSCWW